MNVQVAGLVEGALIGGCVGLVVGLVSAFFRKGKPCPECDKPLPVPWFAPPKECPQCGCRLNAKGERVEDDRRDREDRG